VRLHQARWRLTIEADWGWIHSGNLKTTVRNPGPRDARIEDLYLVVRSSEMGTRPVKIAHMISQGKTSLPKRIASGDPAYFDIMLDLLNLRLKQLGFEGLCRITPVVKDGLGKAYKGSAVAHQIP
jgi:hypothetical protein